MTKHEKKSIPSTDTHAKKNSILSLGLVVLLRDEMQTVAVWSNGIVRFMNPQFKYIIDNYRILYRCVIMTLPIEVRCFAKCFAIIPAPGNLDQRYLISHLETEASLRIAAAALGRGSLVRELLKANADVDIPNQNGATELIFKKTFFVLGSFILATFDQKI